jgi:hypothetical protein
VIGREEGGRGGSEGRGERGIKETRVVERERERRGTERREDDMVGVEREIDRAEG